MQDGNLPYSIATASYPSFLLSTYTVICSMNAMLSFILQSQHWDQYTHIWQNKSLFLSKLWSTYDRFMAAFFKL